MSTSSANNKRIAKNTMMLYIRMAITMLVQLYTSRVVLEVLGIEDYGIWNLVATLVVSISFITGPLSSVIQRFLSYEIGTGNEQKLNIVFSQSVILYSIFSFVLLILFETIGLWLLNTKLTIPADKIAITNLIYQFSIASFIITLLRMPYDAIIIAYERMNFYAYLSIIDVGLKLGIVYLLLIITKIPHLISYGLLTLAISTIITLIYKIYCNKKYACSKIRLTIEKKTLKEMAAFSGWSLMGAFAVMTANQGTSMILNVFYGVTINATIGIANQVGNSVNQFVANFQLAFQPNIVKEYAQNRIDQLRQLVYRASKLSFILLFAISFPIISNIDDILILWLGNETPNETSLFCIWIIISLLIECLSAPLWMCIQASGNIRNYQIAISFVIMTNILFSYILLSYGFPPICVMYLKCIVSTICLIIRIGYSRKVIQLSISKYCMSAILKSLAIAISSILIYYLIINQISINSPLLRMTINIAVFIIPYMFISYFLGFTRTERKHLTEAIRNRINGFKADNKLGQNI